MPIILVSHYILLSFLFSLIILISLKRLFTPYLFIVMGLTLPNTKGAKVHYLKRINQAHLYEIDLNIQKTLKREQINLPFKGVK